MGFKPSQWLGFLFQAGIRMSNSLGKSLLGCRFEIQTGQGLLAAICACEMKVVPTPQNEAKENACPGPKREQGGYVDDDFVGG